MMLKISEDVGYLVYNVERFEPMLPDIYSSRQILTKNFFPMKNKIDIVSPTSNIN